MNILYVMIGVPGSGKSTIAQRLVDSRPNTIWISRDKIRFSIIRENEEYFSKEKEVYREFIRQINVGLSEGHNVIADATHLNEKSRFKLFRNIRYNPNETKIIGIVVDTPIEECIKRNNNRKGTRAFVPINDLYQMYENFSMPTNNETRFDSIYRLEN